MSEVVFHHYVVGIVFEIGFKGRNLCDGCGVGYPPSKPLHFQDEIRRVQFKPQPSQES